MTDETAMPAEQPAPDQPRHSKDEDIVDAEIVHAEIVDDAPSAAVAASSAGEPAGAPQQIIYLHAPAAPRKKGNRGIGALYAVISSIAFAAILALVTAIIGLAAGGRFTFFFVTDARFYIPVLFFVIGFVLLVLILNRAAWWAYIVGSLLLAVFVYFGTVGLGLLGQGIISRTPEEAAAMYAVALRDPFVIASAVVAREVAIWVGAAISARGRRVKARNVEARAAYDKDLADKKAEHERGPVAASGTV